MKRAGALPASCISYALLTLLLTHPLVWHLSSVVPHDAGDPVLNIWLVWWNAHVVPLSSQWWNPPTFHPLPGVLALSEHLLGLAPLTSPIQWLGASPLAAYNVAFLLSFPLSAAAACWLVLSLTGRRDAGFIAGLAFGFAPYRVSQLAHLQVICSYLMPVALLALHRYVGEGRRRWLVVFALSWVLQSLTCGYYLFYFSLLVGLWILWFAARGPTLGQMLAILAVWTASAACLVPFLLGYQRIQQQLGLHRAGFETDLFSADLASLIQGSALLRFWKLPFRLGTSESLLFPGVTAIALVALGVLIAWRRDRVSEVAILPRVRAVLWLLTGVFSLVALSPLLLGPWRVSVAGVALSAGQSYKPLSLAVLWGLLLLFTGRRFRAACRRRSIFGFYAWAAGAMWLLSFGPSPRLMGHQVLYRAPYAWLMWLPGFDALRVPPRFAMLATLCLAVAAGCAFVVLTRRLPRLWRRAAFVVCATGLCIDGWTAQLPLVPAPGSLGLLERIPQSAAVLELPLGEGIADAAALYRSTEHRRPLINGYSGFTPPHYWVLRLGLGQGDREIMTALAERGPLAVAVHESADADGRLSRLVSSQPGTRLLGREAGTAIYLLPAVPPPPAPGQGGGWPIRRIQVSIAGAVVAAGPASLGPWCSPEPQQGNEAVVIDLGSIRTLEAVLLTMGSEAALVESYQQVFARPEAVARVGRIAGSPAHQNATPPNLVSATLARAIVVETSTDGLEWIEAWRGSIVASAYRGALADPPDVRVTVPLGYREGRQVRLRQVGLDEKYPWCFARIAVTGR